MSRICNQEEEWEEGGRRFREILHLWEEAGAMGVWKCKGEAGSGEAEEWMARTDNPHLLLYDDTVFGVIESSRKFSYHCHIKAW